MAACASLFRPTFTALAAFTTPSNGGWIKLGKIPELIAYDTGDHRRFARSAAIKNTSGLVWLASMPLIGSYGVEEIVGGGAELYRLLPIIRRPRG